MARTALTAQCTCANPHNAPVQQHAARSAHSHRWARLCDRCACSRGGGRSRRRRAVYSGCARSVRAGRSAVCLSSALTGSAVHLVRHGWMLRPIALLELLLAVRVNGPLTLTALAVAHPHVCCAAALVNPPIAKPPLLWRPQWPPRCSGRRGVPAVSSDHCQAARHARLAHACDTVTPHMCTERL